MPRLTVKEQMLLCVEASSSGRLHFPAARAQHCSCLCLGRSFLDMLRSHPTCPCPLQREARLEEQQRLRRVQEEPGQQQQGQCTPDAQQSEAMRAQDNAMRSLLQQLAENEGPTAEDEGVVGGAAEGAVNAAERATEGAAAAGASDSTSRSTSARSATQVQPEAAVEPDYILEQQGAQALGGVRPQDVQQSEISR